MKLWIELVRSRVFANETLFAEEIPDTPNSASLDNCPLFVGLGFGDVLEYVYVDGDESDNPDVVDAGIPTARRIVRRAHRRSFLLSVEGPEKLADQIVSVVGQQCLDGGADGAGMTTGTGAVCVPEEHSATDAHAWAWLHQQVAQAHTHLSDKARKALDKGKARLQWYVTSVPEMGTTHAPGMSPLDDPVTHEEIDAALKEAESLFRSSSGDQALELLQKSASQGNPVSLAQFMIECAARGQWGRGLAIAYWADIGGIWDECPPHLDEDAWEESLETANLVMAVTSECARMYLDYPDLEPELLRIVAASTEDSGAVGLTSARVLQRSAELGSADALGTHLWIAVMNGEEQSKEALTLFEKFQPVVVPLQQRLQAVGAATTTYREIVLTMLNEFVRINETKNEDGWGNAQANAGLAYLMQGDEARALDLWAQVQGHDDARIWPAVLLAFKGDLTAGKAAARGVLTQETWTSLLGEMEGDVSPWFAKWREAAHAVRP